MSTERDTHFANAAKFLLQAMFDLHNRGYIDVSDDSLDEEWNDEYRLLIAQFAYDLIYSIAEHAYTSRGLPPMVGEIHQTVKMVPDLTAWPTTGPSPESPMPAPPAQSDAPASPPASDTA